MKKRTVLIPETDMTVGEFDINVDGAYLNVKTLPLDVKPKRNLYVQIRSTMPMDLALSNSDGRCIGFREQMKEGVFGPTALVKKETIALMMGVMRGDLAHITIEAWME